MAQAFDDYKVGQTFESSGRTITETDQVNFVCFSGLTLPIFRDEEYSKTRGLYGRRICPGFLAVAIAAGMIEEAMDLTNLLAALGFDKFRFHKPVFPGDTIHVAIKILSTRVSKSRLDRGVVDGSVSVLNQHGEVPVDFTATWLFSRNVAA
jgi:acyl dehydratase